MKQLLLVLLVSMISMSHMFNNEVRIFLIGDSTVADKPLERNPERGWGQVLPTFFDSNVIIENHARDGKSTKSFINEGRWTKVVDQLKQGDWVFIQFGHNDEKSGDSSLYAAPQTLYRQNLIKFVTEARKKGANPVLVTPVVRRKFDQQGKLEDTHGEYPSVVRAVATETKTPLIDLNQKSRDLLITHGVEGSKKLFLWIQPNVYKNIHLGKEDNTHFSEYGAAQMASLVADEILKQNLSLSKWLRKSAFPQKYVFELPKIIIPQFRKDTFNITNYEAKNDGVTLNTEAIAKAIEACNQAGGGTVLISEGVCLTGPVVLKSNVNLHIRKGAVLLFSSNFDDYPLIKTTYEGLTAVRCQPPISGLGLENIAITGQGVIDAAGDAWRAVRKFKMSELQWQKLIASGGMLSPDKNIWYPSEKSYKGTTVKKPGVFYEGAKIEDFENIKDYLRPNMLSLTNCKGILLEDVTFQNSPAWCLHPLLSEHITLRNLTVKNPWYAQNGDGIDLESCRYVHIDNCTFDVGDDAICIKSGRDEEGRRRGVPTEQAIIENCVVYHGHGGFVIGSEMSGGVRNLYVSNCTFMGTDVGLRFKTARGRGGLVEKIYVSGINMTNIVGEAILFDMYYQAKDPVLAPGEKEEEIKIVFEPVGDGTPKFQDFYIYNIVCNGAEKGIFIRGLPEMNVKNIYLENIKVQARKGMSCEEGENINLKNVAILTESKPVMDFKNSKNITLNDIQYKSGNELLMRIQGERSNAISLVNTDISKVKQEVEFGNNVSKKVLIKK